jgi:hypothetical protein
VKCGIQFVRGIAVIREGPTADQAGLKQELEGDLAGVFQVEVFLDLAQQKVVMKTAGQTLTARLKRPLKRVTHVGFSTWNAVTDFSPLQDKDL